MRRPALVVAALGALALVRRSKAQKAERDLWTEAAAPRKAPDLR